jgi:drug/metabolite transporter (DMT)-like permease
MIGVILTFFASLFEEISSSIGKKEINKLEEDVYTMGFLGFFWPTLFYAIIIFFIRGQFIFSWDSWPTFLIRAILEIIEAHCALIALSRADRTTFSFVRLLTIPLLLLVDLILGYTLQMPQLFGITLIVISLGILLFKHGINKKGIGWVVFISLNAVATISLYKYNITHFNSVETEQFLMCSILFVYFCFLILWLDKKNPFKLLRRPLFLAQSLTGGVGGVLIGFAYNFTSASIATTAKRSSSVIWSTVSGSLYFHERQIIFKITILLLLIIGLILLIL